MSSVVNANKKEKTLQKEPWYRDGLRFGCKQCGGCCGGEPGYVWVTEEEIAAMAKELGFSKFEFENAFVRLIRGKKKSLIERSNGDCVLFDEKKRGCTVYKSRPVQCRTWPFWDQNIDRPSSWEKTAKFCRGCNNPDGKLYTLEEIEEERGKKF
ncbi:MAG: YkgJ family cysteine cluster protein [Thermoguttaceae bacterium]|nr:YkgJ family cysteine cluster protein [Thermoguttaceae bacterium]